MRNIIANFKLNYETFINGRNSIVEAEQWNKNALGNMASFNADHLLCIILQLVAIFGNISQKITDHFNKTFGLEYDLDKLVEIYKNCIDNINKTLDKTAFNGITYIVNTAGKLAAGRKKPLSMVC